MLKKNRLVFLLLPLILILAACSSAQQPATTASSGASASSGSGTTAQQNQAPQSQGQPPSMANQPVEQKLALGTLKLEGTGSAITAAQAKTLLPLWKAVKSLSSSSNTSAAEMSAVYKQIQDAMTAEQVQAIKDLNLSQTDLQTLMQQYGVQMPQMPNGTPVARSQSGSSSSGGTGGGQVGDPGAGGPPMDGGMPPDGGGFGGGQPNAQGTPRAQGTPGAGRGFRGGMNTMFIDPLIKILEQRAGA